MQCGRGEGMREFRKRLNLKSREMAKEIGVSHSYYYKIEENYQNPSYEFMRKLKKRFPEVSIDDLFFADLKK